MATRLATGLGALSLLIATPATATIIITDENLPGNPDENVLLSNDTTGMVIVGFTNNTSTPVEFTGDEDLTDPPSGQARIEAIDGAFTFLTIALQNPSLRFRELEFNLNADADGDVTIFAIDNFGVEFSETFTLDASGENFINLFTEDDQLISLVRIESTVDLEDIRQVRIGGFAVIPEPASWALMLLGFLGAGAALRSSRRRQVA